MTVPCGSDLTLEQRNSVGRKAQQRQMCAELYPASIPHPCVLLCGECRGFKSEFEPITKGVCGRHFNILFPIILL